MKNILNGIIWIVALSGVHAFADVVDFTGAYAPGNWSISGTGVASPGIAQITVTGSNDQSDTKSYTRFMIMSPMASWVTFNWSYTSSDFSPDLDPAGYQIGSSMIQLTKDVGVFDLVQSGSVTPTFVAAGQEFGFYVYTSDNLGGAASLNITDFTAVAALSAVPEPSTYAMVGLAAAATLLRKRFASSAK